MRSERAPANPRVPGWLWVVVFGVAASIAYLCQHQIDADRQRRVDQGELMYFPSTGFTRVATVGYTNLVGDAVWLDIIQYYGRHHIDDMQFRYLKHMLTVLTTLVPQFIHAYNFGALLLITDCNDSDGAFALLDQGLSANPTDWSIPFTRGFFHYVFTGKYREAAHWFGLSARMPDAPDMAARFAAFAMRRGRDPAAARELWQDLARRTTNPTERETAQYYIDEIDRTADLALLQAAVEQYIKGRHAPPANLGTLVGAGQLRSIPPDPLGGRFVLDPATGKVRAIGGRRL
ncbi:MAG TPA: hypothetical protein VMF29_07585 [Candidatus Edwardsbacteria bacterium]|nr:hypothetical protein [Candidatus Edwardsbacteria bacterium]